MYEMTKIDYNAGEVRSPPPAMLKGSHRPTQARHEKWPLELTLETGREQIVGYYIFLFGTGIATNSNLVARQLPLQADT